MDFSSEKRKHQRLLGKNSFRIYSSVSSAAYTVKIDNISRGGAFIRTPHLPSANETITFELVDKYLRKIYTGHAKVKRIEKSTEKDQRGFGIEFTESLPEDLLQN